MSSLNWDLYPNFTEAEFKCSETGECNMNAEFMARLQALRKAYSKPMVITSGYRSPNHSIEKAKDKPGSHASGRAVDIAISGGDAYRLVAMAIDYGFIRIGINQKGTGRFIHLDDNPSFPNPVIWSY